MKREAFLVYGAWLEPLMQLSNESKGMLLVALIKYHNEGVILDLPPDARMAFLFMKKQMDIDSEKYTNICAARAAAGKKGGQKSRRKQNKQMDNKISKISKDEQRQTNEPDNENDNENDNEIDVCITHTNAKQKIKKFYVPGKTDGECQAALQIMRQLSDDELATAASGGCADITLDGMPIYRTGSPEMDMAAAWWVQQERQTRSEA